MKGKEFKSKTRFKSAAYIVLLEVRISVLRMRKSGGKRGRSLRWDYGKCSLLGGTSTSSLV